MSICKITSLGQFQQPTFPLPAEIAQIVKTSGISGLRPVPEFPGYFVTDSGGLFSSLSGGLRPLRALTCGRYLVVNLARQGKRKKQRYIHQIACETFHGPRPGGMQVRHLDGDSHNNQADNLCWGTQAENTADQVKHGRLPRGEHNRNAKLKTTSVRLIRDLISEGTSLSSIGRLMGVSRNTIANIRDRKVWRHA